jgi:hypothetical protein
MRRPLWKTWRAAGAPALTAGAHRLPGVTAITAPNVRGTGNHGRASGASGFPQAVETRMRLRGRDFGRHGRSARHKPAPPYCVYWMESIKD